MKKAIYLLSGVALILQMLMLPIGKVSAASEVIEQYTGGTGSSTISESTRTLQSFRPSKSKLDKIQVEVTAQGGTRTINCSIKAQVSGEWQDLVSCGSQNQASGWMTFDFTDTDVTVGARYAIFLNSSGNGSYPLWKWDQNSGTYPNGYAIHESTEYLNGDYNFKVWGYNPGDQTTDQTVTEQGTSSSSKETPSSNISSSIVKPSELKATYSTETNKQGIKSTWKASTTTSIDGYKIFRSETKGKNYSKVGQTNKSTVEYVGQTSAAGKTYYYIVRAYKGSVESASSNEANATVPTTATPSKSTKPATETAPYSVSSSFELSPLSWYLAGVALILTLILVWLIYRRHKKQT
ncbi:MAG: hypothetical protein NT135_00925 [Candidatus Berkelbacteria bacterium]|nr:hypothetical protein [Candidatus Berkelbacteria bacterium]